MNIQKNNFNANNVSFSGHKKTIDKTGYEKHNFFYLFDPTKYSCELEIYNIEKDKKGNYSIAQDQDAAKRIPMTENNLSVDMSEISEVVSDEGFAYRFKLTNKDTNETSYAFDNGIVLGILDDVNNPTNKYNLILNNRATINKNGPMQLIMPDGYYPGVVNNNGNADINTALRTKALASVRNHSTKLGGNFYGIIERLPQLANEGVARIVGTPFTKDTISSHKYWTENAFQVTPDFGSEEDFRILQEELFKNGINWISDAALVNEGFGGIHMGEMLRKGDSSISKNMFRTGEKPSLGIIPDNSKFTKIKLINPNYTISESGSISTNPDYNPKKPTYVQFYDSRLVTKEQATSDEIIKTYEHNNTDNVYDITKHDDAVYPYALEVDPNELTRNLKRIGNKTSNIDLGNVDTIKQITDFSTFNVVTKSESAGLEVWDGNVDIAKLNFYRCANDDSRFTNLTPADKKEAIADFDRGALAVRDYALTSGIHWTRLTDDIQFSYASNVLGNKADTAKEYMNVIKEEVKNGNLPKITLEKVDEETIQNVLNDEYHLRRLDDADMRADINPEGYGNNYTISDYILRKTMDIPLETMPFANNVLGILTSPYIAKKANIDEELCVSRYDISKANNPNLPEKYKKVYDQAEAIYSEGIVPIVNEIVKDIPEIEEDGLVSDYGKYVISEIASEVTKYVLVKSLAPEADIKFNPNGQINFTNVKEDDVTIQSLGIPFNSKTSEEEAQMLVDLIKTGIDKISAENIATLKANTEKRFENRSLNDFKVAEMIMDRTESGLGWRIDAAKDIVSLDTVRSEADSMMEAWDNVIDFWKKYNESVLNINPHAYTTAEVTDLATLFSENPNAKYTSDSDAERKFLQETGITTFANYNYFFSLMPMLFSDFDADTTGSSWMAKESKNLQLREKLDTGWCNRNPGFLFQSPDDGVTNSYNFFGNHDKPRALHTFGLDMLLFHSDFSSNEHKEIALECLYPAEFASVLTKDEKNNLIEDLTNKTDFDKVNSMAVAMGHRINQALDSITNDDELKANIKDAVSTLVKGQHKGKEFDAEAFGTRPFEIAIKTVLDEAEIKNGKIGNRKDVEAQLLQNILEPAFDRFYSAYKLLVTLPGSPTDFAGDRVGASGYESKSKNYHQQNRNVINWEWLTDDNNNMYKFVKNFYDTTNEIANLRNRKELSALNDGATVSIPVMATSVDTKTGAKTSNMSDYFQAMLRYNDEGSVVLSFHDLSGSSAPYTQKMDRKETNTGNNALKLVLNPDNVTAKQGLKHGIEVGTKFKNARLGDNSTYEIAKQPNSESYYIRRRDSQGKEIPVTITPEDFDTLILYKI